MSYPLNPPTLPDIAHIPLSLHEVLLPSEVGQLLESANANSRPVGEELVYALRFYLEERRKSVALASTVAAAVGLAQPGGGQ